MGGDVRGLGNQCLLFIVIVDYYYYYYCYCLGHVFCWPSLWLFHFFMRALLRPATIGDWFSSMAVFSSENLKMMYKYPNTRDGNDDDDDEYDDDDTTWIPWYRALVHHQLKTIKMVTLSIGMETCYKIDVREYS